MILIFMHYISIQQNTLSFFKNYLAFSIIWIVSLFVPFLFGPITNHFSELSKDGLVIGRGYISFSVFVILVLYLTKYFMLFFAGWRLDRSYTAIFNFSKNKLIKISGKLFGLGTSFIVIFGLIEIGELGTAGRIFNIRFIAYFVLIAALIVQIVAFSLIPQNFFKGIKNH